jgi:23S rRNA (uracil1939-C5)-methyltransferase
MANTESNIFETEITKLITGGAGLGRCGDLAAFIPMTAPGDRVRARIVRRKKAFVNAELVELLQGSPERQTPPCPHFGECGGCDLQHLTGEAQRRSKATIVTECFQRLARLDVGDLLTGPEPAGPELGYRNRIRLFANPAGHYGLMRRGSHAVVPLETCKQMPESFTAEFLPWLRTLPPAEQVLVRLDGRGGFLLSLFGRANRLRFLKQRLGELSNGETPLKGCVGMLYNNLPVWGRDYIVMQVAGKTYRIGPQSFFQANLAEIEAATATLCSWLAETRPAGGLLVDLYSGVGLFSLALAEMFERIVAVESDTHAARDAHHNVGRDKRAGAKAIVQDRPVAEFLSEPQLEGEIDWPGACFVIDPPRPGLGAAVCASIARLAPRDIVYLSCDPATLARDVAALTGSGYHLGGLRVFDFFPQTAHIETLVCLRRQ